MNKSIFSQLPNDIIMNIIKLADGGLYTHKKKFKGVINSIDEARRGSLIYLETNAFDGEYIGSEEETPEIYEYGLWCHLGLC